jgi:hypothetical protein
VLLSAMLVGSWGLLAFPSKRFRGIAPLLFLLGSIGLMLSNQHRIQPWLFQLSTLCFMSVLLLPQAWMRFARWHMVSIYLFSAWSKLDYTFLHSLGQQFIDVLLAPLGPLDWSIETRQYLALAFPLAELFVGIGLCWSGRTRRPAAIAAICLHVMLLGILGPWGLNHHLGVLVWNMQFIAMLLVLCFFDREPVVCDEPTAPWKRYLSWAILLLPLLETVGLLDHWPAWQLYAPRNSRVALHIVGTESIEHLPTPVRKYITGDENSLYRYVDLDAWSLDCLKVPIYPQDRFQVGVAMDFLQRSGLQRGAKVTIESTAARWSGRRQHVVLRGEAEINNARKQFRLNAVPWDKMPRNSQNPDPNPS